MTRQLIQFLEEVNFNEDLQEQVKIAEKFDSVVKIAHNVSYKFTPEELKIGITNLLEIKKSYDAKKFYEGFFIENKHNFRFKKIPEGIGGLDYLNTNIINFCQQQEQPT